MTLTLHDYQRTAVAFLQGRDRAALFLDMGLGKTAATLTALTDDHLPALVVAPKRVAEEVWPVEVAKWRPDLRIRIAEAEGDVLASPAERRREIIADGDADIIAIGREVFPDVLKVRRPRSRPFRTLVVDELSGFRSRSSTRFRVAKRLMRRSTLNHVWGLTGTPAPNGYLNLWAQVYLLDEGKRLGRTIGAYRERWFEPDRRIATGHVVSWRPKEGAIDEINHRIEDICLAMGTEGRIDLPPVTENHVTLDLPPRVARLYAQMEQTMVADATDVLGGDVYTSANAAILTNKLSQISAGFIYPDDRDITRAPATVLHTEKVKAVAEIVEGTGSPVLVGYRFQEERDLLAAHFDGRQAPKARHIGEKGVVSAWNEGKVPVLLAHPASAGHGLNLQYGGHTLVWTSLDWDLELWQQFNKRLARQGQTHPVVIHVILAHGTIDFTIRASLDDKTVLQDGLLHHLESPI